MRPLAEGDIIVAEWHTKYGGYRCHTEYSVYLGKKAPKELLNIWDVSVECLHADSRWKPDVGTMLSDFMVVRPGQAECLIGTPTELAQVG